MSQATAERHLLFQTAETGRYLPRRFGQRSRWRFGVDRRRRYLARISGKPSDAQAALIQSLISLEWNALAAEAQGGLVAFREGRENRRLFQRLRGDFERSLAAPPEPPSPQDILAAIHRRSGGPA